MLRTSTVILLFLGTHTINSTSAPGGHVFFLALLSTKARGRDDVVVARTMQAKGSLILAVDQEDAINEGPGEATMSGSMVRAIGEDWNPSKCGNSLSVGSNCFSVCVLRMSLDVGCEGRSKSDSSGASFADEATESVLSSDPGTRTGQAGRTKGATIGEGT